MQKISVWPSVLTILLVFFFFSCKSTGNEEADDQPVKDPGTPVKVAGISRGPLTAYTELNAVSTFLQKSYVKASTNGYLQSAQVYQGKFVKKGELLFTLKTKEAQSLGNSINILDSTFRFSGMIEIKANLPGYITQLNHQSGDYVQDGEQLATISDGNSFVFLMDLPYELRPYVLNRKEVDLTMPDGQKLHGEIASSMPSVDAVSQTQSIVIKVNPVPSIPENLIAKVRIVKTNEPMAVSVPRTAVLTNETQDDFWVMKMIDSTTAVRIPIKKGIETQDRIEIISPAFSPNDKILIAGNYGLPDSAKVKIIDP
jgi:multidrug efflux pump subunit AcrA (membrane-fusion protein)